MAIQVITTEERLYRKDYKTGVEHHAKIVREMKNPRITPDGFFKFEVLSFAELQVETFDDLGNPTGEFTTHYEAIDRLQERFVFTKEQVQNLWLLLNNPLSLADNYVEKNLDLYRQALLMETIRQEDFGTTNWIIK